MNQLMKDILASYFRMPRWVQIWVALWLVPVNLISLLFLESPSGTLVACLSIAGMLPNLYLPLIERGLGKSMALPHIIPWTLQWFTVVGLLLGDTELTAVYQAYLWVLLATNSVSLLFDYPETIAWFKGHKSIV